MNTSKSTKQAPQDERNMCSFTIRLDEQIKYNLNGEDSNSGYALHIKPIHENLTI